MRSLHIKLKALFGATVAAGFAIALLATPVLAQKVPDPMTQEVLIKSSLLTFNDANVTGNYAVMHAKLSKPFRDQYGPDRLSEVFKVFRDNRVDLDLIAARPPVASEPASVSDNGVLKLYGYFDTTPNRVHYELEYIMSDGQWKLIKINVQLKRP